LLLSEPALKALSERAAGRGARAVAVEENA
jgi:hypothetical protein